MKYTKEELMENLQYIKDPLYLAERADLARQLLLSEGEDRYKKHVLSLFPFKRYPGVQEQVVRGAIATYLYYLLNDISSMDVEQAATTSEGSCYYVLSMMFIITDIEMLNRALPYWDSPWRISSYIQGADAQFKLRLADLSDMAKPLWTPRQRLTARNPCGEVPLGNIGSTRFSKLNGY